MIVILRVYCRNVIKEEKILLVEIEGCVTGLENY